MSLTTETAGKAGAAESADVVIVNLKSMWIASGALVAFYLFIRVYEQIYGWRAGLDSFAPEFQTYWLTMLWTEIPLELITGLGLAGYLWKTRTRDMSALSTREELRRWVCLAQWLVVYSIALYFGASFFTVPSREWLELGWRSLRGAEPN